MPKYTAQKRAMPATHASKIYNQDLIGRIQSKKGEITHDECHAFFTYLFKRMKLDNPCGFDHGDFDYSMELMRKAKVKGYNIYNLSEEDRRFIAYHGWGF